MSELSILTTQNVEIDFTAASIGQRVLGALLDVFILIAYVVLILYLFINFIVESEDLLTTDQWSIMAIMIFLNLPVIFYSLLFETFLEGQTFGKKIVGTRVVKITGYEAGFGDYLIRWLFRSVDVILFLGTIGLVAIVATRKSQRFGDMAAGTAVISLRRSTSFNQTILIELASDYKPTYPQVLKFTDNDIRIIKTAYDRAAANFDVTRMKKIREKVETIIGFQKHELSDSRLIETVLKDYNFYTGQV